MKKFQYTIFKKKKVFVVYYLAINSRRNYFWVFVYKTTKLFLVGLCAAVPQNPFAPDSK